MNSRVETRTLFAVMLVYITRMLGLFMILPVLVLHQDRYVGATALLIGLALGAYGLAQAIFQVPMGRLSDRVGRKAVIIGGLTLFALGSLIAALADSIWLLILGRLVQGAGAVSAALLALLSESSREQNRSKFMAILGVSIGASFGLAMILGPLLAANFGIESIFWLCIGLAVAGAAAVWFLAPDGVEKANSLHLSASYHRQPVHGELYRLNLGIFALHAAQMSLWLVVPLMLLNQFGIAESEHWMWYLVAVGGGFFTMAPVMQALARRNLFKTTLLSGIVAVAAAQLLLFSQLPFALFVAVLVLFFWGFNLLEATLPSLVSKWVEEKNRGQAMGWYSACQFGGTFVGGAVGGWVFGQFGMHAVFLFAFALVAIWFFVALGMRGLPSLKSFVIPPLPLDKLQHLAALPGVLSVRQFEAEKETLVRVDMDRVQADTLRQYGLD